MKPVFKRCWTCVGQELGLYFTILHLRHILLSTPYGPTTMSNEHYFASLVAEILVSLSSHSCLRRSLKLLHLELRTLIPRLSFPTVIDAYVIDA
ncbi:hypothetical protein Bca52824_005261 [Brassica carinata]|uniref:Uncharacterized protein n=1 Tax=Brassica carinata TaxID=52824 RepID=A0A8X7WPT1_BRACI|nr:hypothetical protein Bca52824_005261 [Brassica carinata]